MRSQLLNRRRVPGAAMVEFVLLLPIIILITGLSMYLALGLSTKEDLAVHTRYQVWRDLQDSYMSPTWWWRDDMGGDPNSTRWDGTWSPGDLTANGAPGTGCGTQSQPRGTGDALDYVLANAGQEADSFTSNPAAQQLFNLAWNNLPGRYDVRQSVDYESATPLYKYLNGNIYCELQIDTPDWTHGQLPLWVIANGQDGPMSQVRQIFTNALANVPEPFQKMNQEVIHGWFTESYMMSWNNSQMKVP